MVTRWLTLRIMPRIASVSSRTTVWCGPLRPSPFSVRRWVSELELDLADGGIRVEADPQLARGAVVLLTPTRAYDSRPERLLGDARRRVEALKGLP